MYDQDAPRKRSSAEFVSGWLGVGTIFYFIASVIFVTGCLSILSNDPELSQFHEWDDFWRYFTTHLVATLSLSLALLIVAFNLKTNPLALTFGIIVLLLCFLFLVVAAIYEIIQYPNCSDPITPLTDPVTYKHPHCRNRNGGTSPDDSFFLTSAGIGGYMISTLLFFIFLVSQMYLAQSSLRRNYGGSPFGSKMRKSDKKTKV